MLIFALRSDRLLRGCDGSLVIESVEDTEAKGRVPENLGRLLAWNVAEMFLPTPAGERKPFEKTGA